MHVPTHGLGMNANERAEASGLMPRIRAFANKAVQHVLGWFPIMDRVTTTAPTTATRAIVISDLHLGGSPPYMMSQPMRLAAFLDALPSKLSADEHLELVIAGDFIDFLAIPKQSSWTPEPTEARDKLKLTMAEGSPFAPVFAALQRLVAANHRVTILLGNHDVELALPAVQDELLAGLNSSRHQVLFVDDNRAYRIGHALIEHGNRYDNANRNDWEGLRAIVSAQSRFEVSKRKLEISAGSKIVENVINVIKPMYPFIDLLQPQGELVALLIFAFEPSLIWEIKKIARMLHGQRRQQENQEGLQPGETRFVGSNQVVGEPDEELRRVFGSLYDQLRIPPDEVGYSDLIAVAWASSRDSLSSILKRGEPIPVQRLDQIRLIMQRMLLGDRSYKDDGPSEQYGKAAERLVRESGGKVETVIMGHTHLARHIGNTDRAWYINTGTWADVIRVPPEALNDNEALHKFLRDLIADGHRSSPCSYADLRIEANGRVTRAKLERASP